MKERPILFSAPMVRAILEGRKTQTRRVVKFPKWADPDGGVEFSGANDGPAMLCLSTGCFADTSCRYGAVGDRLWVRETFCIPDQVVSESGVHVAYRADIPDLREERSVVRLAKKNGTPVRAWQPSIYMPREFSRITLEITGVRVERLQQIGQDDCVAEGIPPSTGAFVHHVVADYRKLWSEINGAESWAANPWVWVIELKRVTT